MLRRAQLWVAVSNREESMARVLSRAKLNEGTVLHAHRAAFAALAAVLANGGWVSRSARCADLCAMLEAHNVTPPREAAEAAGALDTQAGRLDPDLTGEAPEDSCTDSVAAECLECVKRVRAFVNAALTR